MDLSWSQTPNSVWWALEQSGSTASLLGDSPASPTFSPNWKLGSANNFYDYADEHDLGESEEEIMEWVKEHSSRGVIRVYQPGFSYSEVVKCTNETTAGSVMARCFAKELFVHYGSNHQRRVRIEEFPLQLQNDFLRNLGHTNIHRMQLEGIKDDLAPLFKFVAGQEKGDRLEERVQLACQLKVKELNGFSVWNKRFCVLCGSRMFIFATSRPKGKPTLVLDLTGGNITAHRIKKHFYCLKVTASKKDILLSFDSRLEQSKWLQRAAKVVSKHPLEANLSGYSLEKVPKYFFLNSNLVAINLAHSHMQERFEHTDAHLLGQSRTIGWISDLAIFHRLVSLSLSDNDLGRFPVSVCAISTLQELDLSCNRIKILPQEVQHMTNLTTLLLHSNRLTSLPYQVNELKSLSTLVLAFNKFAELPSILKELPSLTILVASGNYISSLPDDFHSFAALQHFDVRMNKLKSKLPGSIEEVRNLVRLNVQGNGLSELNMKRLPYLEVLNCSENALRSLEVEEGPLTVLTAKSNRITKFKVSPCELTSIDISRNELTSLPDALTELSNLEKLNASDNKLTELPARIFSMPQLQLLKAFNNRLISLPQAVDRACILEHLDLHGNQLSSLPPQLLIRTNRLQVLNVSSNKLSSLPPLNPLDDLNNVTELYAANNCLRENAIATIVGYRRLKVLHLAYNEIHTVPSGLFGRLKGLEYLNLSGNSLSSLPPLLGCPRLRCLLLHSNQLSTLPNLPTLTHLHTLDLACNQLEKTPKLDNFPYLRALDLSGNSSLTVSGQEADTLRRVSRCFMEGVFDIRSTPLLLGDRVDTGGTTKHGKWSYGSAQIIGVKSQGDCTSQLKVSTASSGQDGLFVVMDGGRSPDAPEALKGMLESVLLEELAEDEKELNTGFQNSEPLQYLVHTFLTAHRKLGEIGQSYGCSVVLCHFHALKDGTYVLNVANTGLGEAILCRSGRAVPLTTPHTPSTNVQERTRVVDAKGFISQDGRVNGVCGTSRLVGCYHLWPQVIPVPSTESVKLRQGDEYVVVGTDGLWKFVTYEQAVHEVQSISDPIRAAKHLRDLAVAHGCNTDISVLVLRLNMFQRDVRAHLKPRPMKPIPEPEDEEEEEDLEVTNIDDILSDTEDDDNQTTPMGVTSTNEMISQDLDSLILSAVKTPPSSPTQPMVKTTNIDDLLPESFLPALKPLNPEFTKPSPTANYGYISPVHKPGSLSHKSYQLPEELDYPAQTIPRDAAGSRAKGTKGVPLNAGFSITETSFEQTQSDPVLNGPQEGLPDNESAQIDENLFALNRTMSELDEEANPERPRKGGKIVRRLSYVEHSYKQLTNDTYSANSLGRTQNTTDLLDDWPS